MNGSINNYANIQSLNNVVQSDAVMSKSSKNEAKLDSDLFSAQLTKANDKAKADNNTPSEKSKDQSAKPKVNGTFVTSGESVMVTIHASDSGFNNKIYWSTDNFKTRHYINMDNRKGNYYIGTFAAGIVIEFGIDNGAGGFYRTGSAAANPDGVVHARVKKANDVTTIGFEDLPRGGDFDFNDALISVRNEAIKPQQGGGISISLNKPENAECITNWQWNFTLRAASIGFGAGLSLCLNSLIKNSGDSMDLTVSHSQKSANNEILHTEKVEIKKSQVENASNSFNENELIKKIEYPFVNMLIGVFKHTADLEQEQVNHEINLKTENLKDEQPVINTLPFISLVQNTTPNSKSSTYYTQSIQHQVQVNSTNSTVELKLLNAFYRYIN